MRHLDTEALAAFVAVIDHGGFTAAGERINKTQAAVSMMISRLEERLGKRLIERSRRGVTLTEAGETLIGYARRMFILEDEALFALRGCDVGRLRVGMPDDYVASVGTAILQQFAARRPDLQVEIICDFSPRLERMLDDGTLDLAMISREKDRDIGELLRLEALTWCTAPTARPEHEQPLRLVLFPEGCRARPRVIDALDRAGRTWRIGCTATHFQGVKAAVDSSHGLTVLPAMAVPAEWRTLGTAEGLPALPSLELALVTRSGAGLAVRHLAQFIHDRFGEAASESDAASA